MQWLTEQNFDVPDFFQRFFLPMMQSIWSLNTCKLDLHYCKCPHLYKHIYVLGLSFCFLKIYLHMFNPNFENHLLPPFPWGIFKVRLYSHHAGICLAMLEVLL